MRDFSLPHLYLYPQLNKENEMQWPTSWSLTSLQERSGMGLQNCQDQSCVSTSNVSLCRQCTAEQPPEIKNPHIIQSQSVLFVWMWKPSHEVILHMYSAYLKYERKYVPCIISIKFSPLKSSVQMCSYYDMQSFQPYPAVLRQPKILTTNINFINVTS